MEQTIIYFNHLYMTGRELECIVQAHGNSQLAGDGVFSKQCQTWLERKTGARKALLTHSCTAALEMAALLLDLKPGDEIIMPSYTFVSTANAFALRGATPVFVDIRPDTLNIDEMLIEGAITPRTRAIVPVHYAGVACEMDVIMDIARRHKLAVVEDAAQGIMSTYRGKALGSIGTFGTLSFHETKNITCGEGGALLVNDEAYVLPAEIIREKGTDRSRFNRGEVGKYTWQSVGSSFLPGELSAAFLSAQMECATEITQQRLQIWDHYHELLAPLEDAGLLRLPIIPQHCAHNAHMYYILLPNEATRNGLITALKQEGIYTVFHYVPLHSSPAGRKLGRAHGTMRNTDTLSARLVRLPLWVGLTEEQQRRIAEAIGRILDHSQYAGKAKIAAI